MTISWQALSPRGQERTGSLDSPPIAAAYSTQEMATVIRMELRRELLGHERAITAIYATEDCKTVLSSDVAGNVWSWAVDSRAARARAGSK